LVLSSDVAIDELTTLNNEIGCASGTRGAALSLSGGAKDSLLFRPLMQGPRARPAELSLARIPRLFYAACDVATQY
jgi:hypothetical protein